MPTQRRFRFGMVSHGAASRDEWYSQARKAEHLGYSTFLVNDHLASTFAPVAAIIAATEATTTLRVGSYVFANDFRHPVMLAKEAATIDVLSNGRFEFGIGTGWAQADYAQSGIPLDSPGVRVSRFAEAVHIIKGAFADAPFSFTGRHYQVQDLQGSRIYDSSAVISISALSDELFLAEPNLLTYRRPPRGKRSHGF